MDQYKVQANQNAETLKEKIRYLSSIGDPDIGTDILFGINYKKFWEIAAEIRDLFKNTKPLTKEDRESLWEDLNNICDRVRYRQNKDKEKFQQESIYRKKCILSDLQEAYHYATGAKYGSARIDIESAKEKQQSAITQLKNPNFRMTKPDSQECWDRYKEVSERIRLEREFLQKISYDEMRDIACRIITTSTYDPHQAIKDIKSFFEKMRDSYLSKQDRGFIMELINEARRNIDNKFEELRRDKERKQKEWEERQQERKRKQEEWERIKSEKIERLQSILDRKESSKEHLEEVEQRIKNKIDELRDKRYSAHGGYADRLDEWIEQQEDRLSDIRDKIRDTESQIDSIREKLSDIRSR